MEREGPEQLVGQESSDLQALQLSNDERHGYIATIQVKYNPLELRAYVSVDRRYRECQNDLICLTSIDLHFVHVKRCQY